MTSEQLGEMIYKILNGRNWDLGYYIYKKCDAEKPRQRKRKILTKDEKEAINMEKLDQSEEFKYDKNYFNKLFNTNEYKQCFYNYNDINNKKDNSLNFDI